MVFLSLPTLIGYGCRQGHSEGRVASAADEIVIDAHVVEALDLSLGDTVNIGAGSSPVEFSIVGIGYHPLHVFMAPEGSIFPPEPGQYVVGYVSRVAWPV